MGKMEKGETIERCPKCGRYRGIQGQEYWMGVPDSIKAEVKKWCAACANQERRKYRVCYLCQEVKAKDEVVEFNWMRGNMYGRLLVCLSCIIKAVKGER